MDDEIFGLSGEEFARFLMGAAMGRPVMDALIKIDDPIVVKQVLCASIDTWCMKYEEDPIVLMEDMLDAMRRVHAEEDDEE